MTAKFSVVLILFSLCLLYCQVSTSFLSNMRIDRHCEALQYEFSIPVESKSLDITSYGQWWLQYWDPTWSCPLEEKIQKVQARKSKGDGAKWICDVPIMKAKDKCIVYSLGSFGDTSFEEGILDRLGCEVHIFDFAKHTPASNDKRLVYHQWGIAAKDKIVSIGDNEQVQFMSLPSIVRTLGHANTVIDILKMDIEGCEFGILDDMSMWQQLNDMGTRFDQLQVEVHLRGVNHETYDWWPSIHFSANQVDNLFHVLNQQGYAMFHKEVNIHPDAGLVPCEFAFVKLDIDCLTRTASSSSPYLNYDI